VAEKRDSRPSLAPAARQDVREVLKWSERNFGEAAAARYKALIKQAVRDIGADPERPGSKERPEIITKGARNYHLEFSRSRVKGSRVKEPRHFLLYRRRDDGVIEVARILHDSRELQRHLPDQYRRGVRPL
jgi:toxin ParE1/3/4